MVIVEHGRNLPESLGHRNLPPRESWGGRARIASLPSVIGLISDRSMLLPQKLRAAVFPGGSQDTGVIIGQKVVWDRNRPFAWLTNAAARWSGTSQVGGLPSVIGTLLSGPSRTVSPEKSRYGHRLSVQGDIYRDPLRAEGSRDFSVVT